MEESERTYCCIDLKSFYASVECVARGVDPYTTNLVVADPERTEKTICLAVSPALKKLGISGRPRVFEIPKNIDFIMAKPRMSLYMEVSAKIVATYLRYISAADLHVYSIDECFIDLTPYLSLYKKSAHELVDMLRDAVFAETKITATAGVGPNLFLAKVALDVLAKHALNNIGVLDEKLFREKIWNHRPITDIWQVGRGIAARLERLGIRDLQGVAHADIDLLYREFGANAEYLIDHAWGIEPCTIQEIHDYVPKSRSISSGQVLMRNYSFSEARRVVREQMEEAVLDLVDAGMATNCISLYVGYAKEARALHGGGSRTLPSHTDSLRLLAGEVDELYRERVDRRLPIRRLGVSLSGLVPVGLAQPDLFSKERIDRERTLNRMVNLIRKRFGRGSLLRGTSYLPAATGRERSTLIGGHRAR